MLLRLTLILSRKVKIWGEVYTPVLYPAFSRMYAVFKVTDPFPFVPVMWIDLNDLWGLSSLWRS